MPAWDLLLTQGARLLGERQGHRDWRDVVGYAFADEWTSENTLGLSMAVPRFMSDRSAAVPALVAERANIVEDDYDGAPSSLDDYPWWLMQRLDELLGPLFGWWAVERALKDLAR